MTSLLALALSASPALAADPPSLHWSWDDGVHHRFYIENEVHLPYPVMLYQEFNREARLVAFQSQLVLDCTAVDKRRKEWELECGIEGVSFVGATVAGDRGDLAPVLQEVDDRITGAMLQVWLREDGRIRQVDLEGVTKVNRRMSQNTETLRLLLIRGLAGLDLQLARSRADEAAGWPQFQSLLLLTPHNRGNQGAGELVHRIRSEEGDVVVVDTRGRGSAAQATDAATGPSNIYMMELESTSRYDRAAGVMTQRKWTVIGEPTAGSAVSDGVQGITYLQAGSLSYLSEGVETPDLWDTRESSVPGATGPSAITTWSPIPALNR